MGCASSSGNKSQKVEPVSQEPEAPRFGKDDELRENARGLHRVKFCGECGEKMLEWSRQCVQCDYQERAQPGSAVSVALNQPRSTWPTQPPPTRVKPSPQHPTMNASSRYQVAAQLAYPPIDKPKAKSKSKSKFDIHRSISHRPETGLTLQTSSGFAQPISEEQMKGLLGSLLSGPVPLHDIGSRSDRKVSLPTSCPVFADDIGKGGKGCKKITMQEFMDQNKHLQSAA